MVGESGAVVEGAEFVVDPPQAASASSTPPMITLLRSCLTIFLISYSSEIDHLHGRAA
jgi:hypothetical protein